MIQQKTNLKVIDNSGVKTIKCIKILNGFKKKTAKMSDLIVVSIKKKKVSSNSKLKKGEIHTAVVIRTKKKTIRKTGVNVRFDENSAVLITKTFTPLFTRIFGKVPKRLRTQKFLKLYTLSTGSF